MRRLRKTHIEYQKYDTDYNTKISEIEGKIPSITGLVTISALTAVESKIPNISKLAKKTDYNTKVTEIDKKITESYCRI